MPKVLKSWLVQLLVILLRWLKRMRALLQKRKNQESQSLCSGAIIHQRVCAGKER